MKLTCSREIWVPGLATFELYGGIPKQTTLVGLMGSESSEETWLQTTHVRVGFLPSNLHVQRGRR